MAITGVANPDLLPSIRDRVEKAKVPLLAAHGSSADMSSAVYIWRTAFLNDEPGRAVGLYLRSRTERGRVSLIGLQDNFAKDAMTGLETEHGNVTERVWVQPTATPIQATSRNDVRADRGMDPNGGLLLAAAELPDRRSCSRCGPRRRQRGGLRARHGLGEPSRPTSSERPAASTPRCSTRAT